MARKKRDYKKVKVPHQRSDVLKLTKIVCGKIGNKYYVQLRAKLFLLELSPTDIVSEFLMLFLEDDKRATSIVNNILERKRTCKLKKIEYTNLDQDGLTDNDKLSLYDYFEKDINEKSKNEDDE